MKKLSVQEIVDLMTQVMSSNSGLKNDRGLTEIKKNCPILVKSIEAIEPFGRIRLFMGLLALYVKYATADDIVIKNFFVPVLERIFSLNLLPFFDGILGDREMMAGFKAHLASRLSYSVSYVNLVPPILEQTQNNQWVIQGAGKSRLKMIRMLLTGCGAKLFFDIGVFAQIFDTYQKPLYEFKENKIHLTMSTWSKISLSLIAHHLKPSEVDVLLKSGHLGRDATFYLRSMGVRQIFELLGGGHRLFSSGIPKALTQTIIEYENGTLWQELQVLGQEINQWLDHDQRDQFTLEGSEVSGMRPSK